MAVVLCACVCVCTRYAHSLLFFVLHLRLKAQGSLIEHAPVLLPLLVAIQTRHTLLAVAGSSAQ